jgi:tetraacyldisaccharide-1-P 4'-kinase
METTNTPTTNDNCFLSRGYGRTGRFKVTTGTSTTTHITTTATTTGDE